MLPTQAKIPNVGNMHTIKNLITKIQYSLFPELEEHFEEKLSPNDEAFIKAIELIRPDRFLGQFEYLGRGQPPKSRLSLFLAFLAKSIYGIATTTLLIDYLNSNKLLRNLCGYEYRSQIPSESTFSRAFAQFSEVQLLERIHQQVIKENLSEELVFHISRDSTSIEVREKPAPKKETPASEQTPKRKRGRPRKTDPKVEPEKTRLERQKDRSLEENLKDLPEAQCEKGTKKNASGYKHSWNGYKLHLDVIDGDIPISAILTGAAIHDSQLAIPLAQMSHSKVTSLYDLMDAAYDAAPIKEVVEGLGRVPIIDPNPRSGPKVQLPNDRLERFKNRSSVERVNGNLKDNFGGRSIRVKGATKVMCHLMFGLIALTAAGLYRAFT